MEMMITTRVREYDWLMQFILREWKQSKGKWSVGRWILKRLYFKAVFLQNIYHDDDPFDHEKKTGYAVNQSESMMIWIKVESI